MKIEHIAIWTKNLEASRAFYMKYFEAVASEKYVNVKKGFSSYFLSFASGCRLEIMHMAGGEDIAEIVKDQIAGLSHFTISVGSKERVDALTEQMRKDGFTIAGAPRQTGDGYYESIVLDPDGNRIEITI